MNLRPLSNWLRPPPSAVCRFARYGESAGGATGLRQPGAASEWQAQWQRRQAADLVAAETTVHSSTRRTPRMARVEAALFVTDRPLAARRLAQSAALVDADDAVRAVAELNAALDAEGSPFRIELVATGYQLLTRPEFAPWLEKVHSRQTRLRLSPPAMETLAIVAYRQPLTRADVEAVRGVQSGEMLKALMERDLVKIVGEHDSLGRPYLYGTTRQFLELYGLHSLSDLPHAEGLAPPAAELPADTEFDAECDPADGSEAAGSAAAA